MDREKTLDELRRAVAQGTLPTDVLRQRLMLAVEAEYARPSPDAAFVRALESLLRELAGAEAAPSAADDCLAAVRGAAAGKATGRWKWIAAAAAALVLALSLHTVSLRWIEAGLSVEGEQYVLQGREVTLDMVTRAEAACGGEERRLTTEDPAAVEAMLGFLPPLPRPETFGAARVLYAVSIIPEVFVDLAVLYEDAQGVGQAVYTVTYYTDQEFFRIGVEQSAPGVTVEVDGTQVYCADNLARRTYLWTEDLVCHCLSGYLDDDTAFAIVREIMR